MLPTLLAGMVKSMRKPPLFQDHPVAYEEALNKGLFRCICHHVVDGDTADFMVDLGWNTYSYVSLRFIGINAPELKGGSMQKGLAAKARIEGLLLGRPCLLKSYKGQTFERFLGEVWIFDTNKNFTDLKGSLRFRGGEGVWVSVNSVMLEEGLAVEMGV